MLNVYNDRTTAYAAMVVEGGKVAGVLEILACQRHLDDLENNKEYYFDITAAEFAINFVNSLTMKDGTPLETRGFQDFIIGSLFGWKEKASDELRYQEAYIQVGRQNGKSFLIAAIITLVSSVYSNKDRLFCAATKQDQANIVWDDTETFIEMDPDLSELYKIRKHDRIIESLVTGSYLKSLGRDTKTLDGFRNKLSICDELHAHINDQMYNLLMDGQANVTNSLILAITTAGFNLNGFCYEHYLFCIKILKKIISKDTQFIFICQMDKNDDIWDERNWQKANPFYLFNPDGTPNEKNYKKMRQKAISAKYKGGDQLTNFQTKQLNTWVSGRDTSYIDLDKFQACAQKITLEDMRGKEAFLGFDLSSGGDLTSISLTFPLPDGKIYVYSHSFMPELRLQEHERTDKAPYRQWVRSGHLTLTTGAYGYKTDYKFIISHLKEILEVYDIKILECGYDAYNAGAFLDDLAFLNCDLTEVKQSAKSLGAATVDFKESIDALQVVFDESNGLFKWSVANAITTQDSFGNVKVDKAKQTNRIDPIDATLDAWKVMLLHKQNDVDINKSVEEWLKLYG